MVTFEQLRKIARENVTDLMLMELLKEFPHLNPDRANHVCCYIARMLGLANQYVYNHEEWNYIGEVGNETILVHPDHGIKFGDINKIIEAEQEEFEEEDLCQCEDCVRARQRQEESRAQETARISDNSSAPLISGVTIDEASEVVPQSVIEPPAPSSEYPVFETEEPPTIRTSGTFSIEDSTFRWWNGSQIRREIEDMNRYYNYISPRNPNN